MRNTQRIKKCESGLQAPTQIGVDLRGRVDDHMKRAMSTWSLHQSSCKIRHIQMNMLVLDSSPITKRTLQLRHPHQVRSARFHVRATLRLPQTCSIGLLRCRPGPANTHNAQTTTSIPSLHLRDLYNWTRQTWGSFRKTPLKESRLTPPLPCCIVVSTSGRRHGGNRR